MATAGNVMESLRRDINRAFHNAGSSNEPLFRTAFLPGQAARRYPLINLSEDRDQRGIETRRVDPNPNPGQGGGSQAAPDCGRYQLGKTTEASRGVRSPWAQMDEGGDS